MAQACGHCVLLLPCVGGGTVPEVSMIVLRYVASVLGFSQDTRRNPPSSPMCVECLQSPMPPLSLSW